MPVKAPLVMTIIVDTWTKHVQDLALLENGEVLILHVVKCPPVKKHKEPIVGNESNEEET